MPRALLKENPIPLHAPNISSSTSVKLRKSSNLFSTLVRKARRKKTLTNGQNGEKTVHVSSQNVSGSSTLSAHIEEEVEINCQNFEKKCSQNQQMLWEGRVMCSGTNTSNVRFIKPAGIMLFIISFQHSGSSNKTPKNMSLRTTQSYSEFNDPVNFHKVHNQSMEEKSIEDDLFTETSPEDIIPTSYL